MKTKKGDKKERTFDSKEDSNDVIRQRKKPRTKVKYNHKNHWLEQDDDDYELPSYKDEEE